MKSKIIWIVTAVLFIGLIVGASLLYNKLGEENMPNQPDIVTKNPSVSSENIGTENKGTENNESSHVSTPEEIVNNMDPAHNFTVIDESGKQVKLSDFVGKPIVINFWASYCSPCKNEMPHFENMYKTYGDDVHFLMINVGESFESEKKFIEKLGYTFPLYFDPDGNAFLSLARSNYIPLTCFFDKTGKFVDRVEGLISASTLQSYIDLITQ